MMATRQEHLHNTHFIKSALQPCLILSCLMLLPIILGGDVPMTKSINQVFSGEYYLGSISAVASIPFLAVPLFFAQRRVIFEQRVSPNRLAKFSGILGVALSLGSLYTFLNSKSNVLGAALFISIILALVLNSKDILRLESENRKLHKKK